MLTLSKRTVTLDISPTAIKLLMLNEQRIERWAWAPLEPGLIRGGFITDPSALGSRIKRCMKQSSIKGRKVIASINGLYSIYRIIYTAQFAKKSLQQSIMQAVTQAIPVSTEEFYISWQSIPIDKRNQQVLVAAMPQHSVNNELQALKAGGIDPHVLNLKGMALARLVNRQHALVINIEPDSIDIVLKVNGTPQIIRTIPHRQNIPLDILIEQLTQTLDHIIYFHNIQNPHSPLKTTLPLFLIGQLTDDADFMDMVKNKINHPLTPLSIPLEHPENLPVNLFAINIGLALEQVPVHQRKNYEL